MIRLVKNELFKVFHRKSIYVFGILILVLCLLNNILFRTTYDEEGFFIQKETSIEDEIDTASKQLNKLDFNNEKELDEYINAKTYYDLIMLKKDNNYKQDTWQYRIIDEELNNIVHNINYYTYKEENKEELEKNRNLYNTVLTKLKEDNWKYFANLKLDNVNAELTLLKSIDNDSSNSLELKVQGDKLFSLNLEKEELELRLKNNISYDKSYLDSAINDYKSNSMTLHDMDKKELTYGDKLVYQRLLSDKAINKYVIENKKNVAKPNNLRTGLRDLITDYELLIILFVIVIASSIVSSEFKDGTIKLLLTKPYTRSKILFSKYLTCLISLGIIILYTFICQFVIGTICFGLDSLTIPVLIYNYNTNNLMEFNVFIYMLFNILCKIPMHILILTLAFTLSTIFNSTSLANTLTILGYLFKDIIYTFVNVFGLKFLKYFVSLNWNFTEYLYGKLPSMEGLTLNISIIICLFYYLIMMIVGFMVFKKKNIKNI